MAKLWCRIFVASTALMIVSTTSAEAQNDLHHPGL